MCHAPPLGHLKDVINVIQMPLFFSVSGFCFLYTIQSSRGFSDFIKAKARRILVPFFVIGLLWMYPIRMLVRYPAYQGHSIIYVIFKDIVAGYDNGHLWFLPTLFLMLVITWILNAVSSRRALFDVLLIVVGVVGLAFFPSGIPYVREFGMYYLYFVIGLLIHEHEEILRIWTTSFVPWIMVLLTVGLLIAVAMGVRNGMVTKIASLVFVVTCYRITPNKSNMVMRAISKNSMGMYLFHSPLLYLSFAYWPNINPWLMLVINFLGFGLIAYALTEIMRRLRLSFVIGE